MVDGSPAAAPSSSSLAYEFELVPHMDDGTVYGGVAIIAKEDPAPLQTADRLIRDMVRSMAGTHRRVADQAAVEGETIDVEPRIAYLNDRLEQPPSSPPYSIRQVAAISPVPLKVPETPSGPTPQTMPAAGSGWAPDFGMWLVFNDGKVVPSGSNVEYNKILFSGYSSWHTTAQLARYRNNANSGYELNFAYKQYENARRSGVTSQTTGYISDFPGHYAEFITVDDNLITYGVGTHEADKIQLTPDRGNNGYWIDITVADQTDYNVQRPGLTIYGQYDTNMSCGNLWADACFNKDGSFNYANNFFCAYPIEATSWDFRGTTVKYARPPGC
jgi:hypothetical protein